MNRMHRIGATALLVLLITFLGAVAGPAHAAGKRYVCPPCGQPCDTTTFDAPGTCPLCGMALVEQGTATASFAPGRKVAILVFNGVEIVDFTGPYEMFGAADFDVYTVAASTEPVTTAMGMTVVPKYSFANAPPPDVLVVPGGSVRAARNDPATRAWVKATAEHARQTMSVCNGAFILAAAGLLDGLRATTTAGNLEPLRSEFPKIHVVEDQRVVDNGRIVTAGGLSAGIDGALHEIDKLLGHGQAQQVALDEEYDWQPNSGFARGALAERLIPGFEGEDLGAPGPWETLRTEGGRDHWDVEACGPFRQDARALYAKLGELLAARGHWTPAATRPRAGTSSATGSWKIGARDGRAWSGTLSVAADPGGDGRYVVKIHVARAG